MNPVHWVEYLTADDQFVIVTEYQAEVVATFPWMGHKDRESLAKRWAKRLNRAYAQGRADGRDAALTSEIQELVSEALGQRRKLKCDTPRSGAA